MEIIQIRSNAIKVILDSQECQDYVFLNNDKISDERFLGSIDKLLFKVKEKEKIDLSVNKLLIQVYPLKNFGCEIYICDTEEENMYKDRVASGNLKKNNTYTGVYRFDSLDKLLFVCQRLSAVTDEEGAQAYYDEENGNYYLICRSISPKELRFAFINEYAKQLKASYAHHVREHLRCFCEANAIKKLSNLV